MGLIPLKSKFYIPDLKFVYNMKIFDIKLSQACFRFARSDANYIYISIIGKTMAYFRSQFNILIEHNTFREGVCIIISTLCDHVTSTSLYFTSSPSHNLVYSIWHHHGMSYLHTTLYTVGLHGMSYLHTTLYTVGLHGMSYLHTTLYTVGLHGMSYLYTILCTVYGIIMVCLTFTQPCIQ